MYRSSPLRSTLNTSYIRFGYVSVSSMYRSTRCDKKCKKKSPKAKTRPGKKGTKARKGCVSGSANVPVCGYIYIYMQFFHAHTHISSSLQRRVTSDISRKKLVFFSKKQRSTKVGHCGTSLTIGTKASADESAFC